MPLLSCAITKLAPVAIIGAVLTTSVVSSVSALEDGHELLERLEDGGDTGQLVVLNFLQGVGRGILLLSHMDERSPALLLCRGDYKGSARRCRKILETWRGLWVSSMSARRRFSMLRRKSSRYGHGSGTTNAVKPLQVASDAC